MLEIRGCLLDDLYKINNRNHDDDDDDDDVRGNDGLVAQNS